MLAHLKGNCEEKDSKIGDFFVATLSVVKSRDKECLTMESVVRRGLLYIVTILEDVKIGHIFFSFSITKATN